MQDRPSAQELVSVVAAFLERELIPSLADSRLRFRALVAASMLNIVSREMELGNDYARAEWERLRALLADLSPDAPTLTPDTLARSTTRFERERASASPDPSPKTRGALALRVEVEAMTRDLCERIRDGHADEGEFRERVLAHVEQTVIDKLRVANPKFLARVRRDEELGM